MNIKKLIATVFALSLGVVSNLASANTNYDFTATFSNNYLYNNNNYTLNGVVSVGNTPFDISILSLYENGNAINPISPSGRVNSPGTGWGPGNFNFVGSPDFSFQTSFHSNIYSQNGQVTFSSIPVSTVSLLGSYGTGYGAATVSLASGVAPEMNASMIPQVGLLLGCLFFLFGRKKENTEPMLAA